MSEARRDAWSAVMTSAERRSLGLRLAGDLAGGGLLVVGLVLLAWRPDQPRIAALVQGLAALTVGIPVLVRGLPALVSLRPRHTTDQLVSLAVLAAWAQGAFVTATLVPLILDIGRLFEERSSLGAQAAIAALQRLEAREATRVDSDGGEVAVPLEQLGLGERVRVRPGQVIPVDGRVVTGHGAVDQAPITGESRPEDVEPGAEVFAGTLNVSGLLDIEVTGLGAGTVLGRVAALLREVAATRPSWVRSLERLGAAYVPLVLTVAATTLYVSESVDRAIAVLVVAAPTALVVAGPAAMVAALSLAARRDMLIKDADFLEAATTLDTLVIDKTGTLTTGALVVAECVPAEGIPTAELLSVAAACGHGSLHPVARAVVAAARSGGASLWAPEQVEEVPGLGTRARLDGQVLCLGRPSWLRSLGVEVPPAASGTGVARDGRWLGSLVFSDTVRPGAAAALDRLRSLGIQRMVLVTGDRREEAERVGALLGLDEVVSEVLPEDKLSVVEGEQARGGRVLMVGDGANDALALSRADVGVALGARVNDIVLGGADVALLTGDPHRIPELLELAGRARRTVWQNLALALGLVALMVAAAARGSVSPLMGALVHDLGAVLVVANAARMLRGNGPGGPPSPTGGNGGASGPAAIDEAPIPAEG